jgi:hypothetical protein
MEEGWQWAEGEVSCVECYEVTEDVCKVPGESTRQEYVDEKEYAFQAGGSLFGLGQQRYRQARN